MSVPASLPQLPERCVTCGSPLDRPVGCTHCDTNFPQWTGEADHYARMGLQRRYDVDLEDLELRFLERSRQLHPDFHQLADSDERERTLQLSAELNEAYATLADPFRRAEYLLRLQGGPSAAECRDMPADFLERVLETRMEIEELHESGDASSSGGERLRKELRGEIDRHLSGVATLLDECPTDDDTRAERNDRVRRELNAVKYLQGLLRDLTELRNDPAERRGGAGS